MKEVDAEHRHSFPCSKNSSFVAEHVLQLHVLPADGAIHWEGGSAHQIKNLIEHKASGTEMLTALSS